MPERKIILHVGQSKAGSTSIQNYLEQQYAALAADGILFPTSVFSRKNSFDQERTSGHRQLLSDIKSGDVHAFEEEVAEHQPHTIILSIEGLFSGLPLETLQSLREYLSDDEIELIAVLRPQLDWLRSRYVEEVMTGFQPAFTEPFSTFAHQARDSEALSYRRRLRHISEVFSATKTTAIAMTKRDTALVHLFLEAAGLPIGDVALARKMHSNRRNKAEELIEAKRRLNALTGALETQDRLGLEHSLREHAAVTTTAPSDASHSERHWRTPFEDSELDTMRRDNIALHRDGVLDAPLPIGELGNASEQFPRQAHGQMREIFDYGLSEAIEVAARVTGRSLDRASPMSFTPPEAAAISDAMQGGRVSLHLNSAATATLAACFDSVLVNLLLYPSERSYRLIQQLEQLHTASPMTAVTIATEEVSHLTQCMQKLGLVVPDLIVVGGQTTARPVQLAIERIQPQTLVLLDGAVDHAAGLQSGDYAVESVGCCMILRRNNPA